MDLSALTASHARRLRWFEERAGTVTRYPKQLDDGSFLVSRPKGIYKPSDLPYALSVRINLNSPYNDGAIYAREDGTWYFSYHQENPDPSQRDEEFTNRGLMECIRHAAPVGVLREHEAERNRSPEYLVLGLAVPVAWESGYFFFEGVRSDGILHGGDTASEVLVSAAEAQKDSTAGVESPPSDDYDARLRVVRQIVARRGQRTFRAALLQAYRGRCAITGADAEAVLEAAHLRPYRGIDSNILSNGLLLRADVHTLLDLRLLAIEPISRRVRVSQQLAKSSYWKLDGVQLSEPAAQNQRPALTVLENLWKLFREAENKHRPTDPRSRGEHADP
ncbi:HNH endonuclease [Micromonospora sp. L31]|uniref:HNH endonuclease n=1 Tax=Micromonospora sp. L31 TaxID=3452213 RepID=UPI003F88A4CE